MGEGRWRLPSRTLMLQTQNMAPKGQTAFRADPALLAGIDAMAAQIRREYPDLNVNRTDAIVMLLKEALRARGIEVASPGTQRTAPAKASAKKGAKRARKP